MSAPRSTDERFYKKVEQPPYSAACWLWLASRNPDGYGHFFYNDSIVAAHRVSWMMHRGEIPAGLNVLHKCDNPKCVNPAHLFLGTHQDNADDKMKKGRHTEKNKTHCRRGHELAGDNLYINPHSDARVCRSCQRMVCREHDRRRRPPKQGPRLGARKTVEDLPREVAA